MAHWCHNICRNYRCPQNHGTHHGGEHQHCPLYFSNTQPCPELQPKTLPHLQLTRKLSSRALFPRSSPQLKLSLGSPHVPGIWGQRVTAATRCHLCAEAAGSVTVHGHGHTRAAPLPLHFRQLRHKSREVFRTSLLQETEFPPPEHQLCLQPRVAHFGTGSALPEQLRSPSPGREEPSPAFGGSLSTPSPENPPCPAPGHRRWGRGKHSCLKPIFYQLISFWTNVTTVQRSD